MSQNSFILLLLLSSVYKQDCGEGCQKCGSDQVCLVCNFNQGFVNKSGTCQRQVDTKCINQGSDGNCLHCNINYKLDPQTQKCVKISNQISQCLYYNESGSCQFCRTGYYPLNNTCAQATINIPNCLYLLDSVRCAYCSPWYTLSSDYKSCTKETDIENCDMQTNFHCEQCKDGYILNQNNYIYDVFDSSNRTQIYSFISSVYMNQETNWISSPCQQIQLQNCNVAANAFECSDCKNQYYLTSDKKCQRFPFVIINKCIKYISSNICIECENMYFLNAQQNQCLAHTATVPDCKIYSQNVNGQCSICNDNFYRNGNTCVQRTLPTIQNCLNLNILSDGCSVCEQGFKLTFDAKKCWIEIPDCISYSEGDGKYICQKCQNGKYADILTGQCQISNAVTYCDVYSDQNTCESCFNGYYLFQQVCYKHPDITNCVHYSNLVSKQCNSCDTNSFLFNLNNTCILANTITGCYRYQNADNCVECLEGYTLDNLNKCLVIDENLHCKRFSNGNCTKCNLDYFLHQGKCYPFYHYQSLNCNTIIDYSNNVIGHVDKLDCQKCNFGFLWKDLSNDYLCVNQTQLPSANLVNNCSRYNFNVDKYLCQECKNGFYLTEDAIPQCVNSCNTVFKASLTFNNNANKEFISNRTKNVCSQANSDKVYSVDSSLSDQLLIGACPSTFLGIYHDKITSFNIISGQFTNGFAFATYSSCKDSATVNSFPTFNSINNHCQHYTQKGLVNNNNFYCISCKKGWTGKVMKNGSDSYVTCDTQIDGCSSELYGGFYLNQRSLLAHNFTSSLFYSCHKCSQNYIPFYHVSMDSNLKVLYNNFQPFDMDNVIPESNGGEDLQIQCLVPQASDFQMDPNLFTLSFPQNCGLGLFDTSTTKSYSSNSKKSLYCAECQSGYKKIYDNNNIVTQCKLIPNCDSNKTQHWFNQCSQCESTHAWSWDQTNGTNYDECVLKTIPNCQIVFNDVNTQVCKQCDIGFDIVDGKCEQYTVATCSAFLQESIPIQRFIVDTLKLDNFWQVAYKQTIKGCSSCVANDTYNYVSVLGLIGQHEACVSSYIAQNQKTLKFTLIIPYCVFYSGEQTICLQCNEGYILKNNGNECVNNVSYSNCTNLNAQNDCISCEQDYHLILKKCVKGTITNCIGYDSNSVDQLCTLCIENYRPSYNKKSCILGNLQYCQYYQDTQETNCLNCQNKGITFKYTNQNNRTQCFPPLENLNCEQLSLPGPINQVNSYQCSLCKPGYYLSTDQELYNRSICIAHQGLDQKCIQWSYDGNNYFSSSFKCLKCEEGYFVDTFGYTCQQRTITIQNCLQMDNLSQKCTQCESNYYLSNAQDQCLKYPSGVLNCTYYSDDNTCKSCDTGFYLSNNLCLSIPQDKLIVKCRYYDSQIECIQCDTNYVLNLGACISPTAQNCLTFNSPTDCKTCLPKYYRKKRADAEVFDCVFKDIPYCVQLDLATGNCSLCLTQYYIDSLGNCKFSNFINKCLVYSGIDTCKQCEENYFVSENSKTCEIQGAGILNDMTNCSNLVYKKEKKCMVCDSGYYFSDNKCNECKAGEGCAVCDYRAPTICLMCANGYHQTAFKGKCTKSPLPAFDPIISQTSNDFIRFFGFLILSLFLI